MGNGYIEVSCQAQTRSANKPGRTQLLHRQANFAAYQPFRMACRWIQRIGEVSCQVWLLVGGRFEKWRTYGVHRFWQDILSVVAHELVDKVDKSA